MKLVGMMPVRNEDWILGFSLRVALQWCDHVVVLLHDCTDDSAHIVESIEFSGYKGRVTTLERTGQDWQEMTDRQTMLRAAQDLKATHLAIIDADEVLTANLLPVIRAYIEGTPAGWMVDLPGYNLRDKDGSCRRYHNNGVWGNRWFSTAFLNIPTAGWNGPNFHHRDPMGVSWRRARPLNQGQGGTLHFWGASARRLVAKHALYKMVERIKGNERVGQTPINDYYSLAIVAREKWTYADVPDAWMAPYRRIAGFIHFDRYPWQEAECKRLYQEYGAEQFNGLDLFGVV